MTFLTGNLFVSIVHLYANPKRSTLISKQARHCLAERISGLLQSSLSAHYFFTSISFITSISRSRAAKIFLNRLFSYSKALSLRTPSVSLSLSPNLLRREYIEGSRIPWHLANSANGDRSAVCKIRIICSFVNRFRFIATHQVRAAIVSKVSRSSWAENPRTDQLI
jgi:hypothetical protein